VHLQLTLTEKKWHEMNFADGNGQLSLFSYPEYTKHTCKYINIQHAFLKMASF